jgi:hypothetical protein
MHMAYLDIQFGQAILSITSAASFRIMTKQTALGGCTVIDQSRLEPAATLGSVSD